MRTESLNLLKPSLSMVFNSCEWQSRKVIDSTNCYAYALNEPKLGWAHPGEIKLGRTSKTRYDCYPEIFSQLVEIDGLIRIYPHSTTPENSHVIALWLRMHRRGDTDFHFARMDRNKNWSNKLGCAQPIDRLTVNIDNPNVEEYDTFVGFYKVPNEGIRYYPRTNYTRQNRFQS